MATTIPGDAKDKALFLYHPTIPGSKRIDIDERKNPNAKQEIDALKREGWTETRFAQIFYHRKMGQKLVTNPKDVAGLKKSGWQDEPFHDAEAHKDAQHPHFADDHRVAHLAQEAEEEAAERKSRKKSKPGTEAEEEAVAS